MSRRNKFDRRTMLDKVDEQPTIQDDSDEIYETGTGERASELRTGRETAKPISIFAIWPDPIQPRRTIPAEARKKTGWTGEPDGVMDAFHMWQAMAEEVLERTLLTHSIKYKPFDVQKILKGQQSISYKDADDNPITLPPVAVKFINVLELAASIYNRNLINAIHVAATGETYMIESGERRWLAHHVLNHYIGKKYEKIKSVLVELDVWRQAAENNNRDGLNAISRARQLAVLIMDMYAGDDGVEFYPLTYFDTEQEYYAQVANGRVWQIKSGFADLVQSHTDLRSNRVVSAYRSLLRIPNEIWVQADTEDWAEGAIRNYLTPEKDETRLPIGKRPDDETTLPVGKVADDKAVDKSAWSSAIWIKKHAWAGNLRGHVLEAIADKTVQVRFETYNELGELVDEAEMPMHLSTLEHNPPDGADEWASAAWLRKWVAINDRKAWLADILSPDMAEGFYDNGQAVTVNVAGVREWVEQTSPQPSPNSGREQTPTDGFGLPLQLGQHVRTRTGHVGKIVGMSGQYFNVMVNGRTSDHKAADLEVVNSETGGNPASAKPANTSSSSGESWVGKIVSTVVGAIAKVTADRGDDVRLMFPNNTYADQQKKYLTFVEYQEWTDAVTKQMASQKDHSAKGDETTDGEWKAYPASYNGEPCLVQTRLGDGVVRILDKSGQPHEVLESELGAPLQNPPASDDTHIGPDGDGKAISVDESDEYVLFDSHPFRGVLALYRDMLPHDNELAHSIRRFLALKHGDLDMPHLKSLLNFVGDGIEQMNNEILRGIVEAEEIL